MSLPTTVFIVAGANRQVHVGYSKDLEVTLSLIADGTYDPVLAKKGIDKLVYVEEHNIIREAMARVDEIEALSLAGKRRLVSERNPGWKALAADGRFAHGGIAGRAEPSHQVYVVADDQENVKVGYTGNLLVTMIRLRAKWLDLREGATGSERLVHLEPFSGNADAAKRARQLKRLGPERIVEFVKAANPSLRDVTPSGMLAAFEVGSPIRTMLTQRPDAPGSAGGGVTADLRGGPRTPTGVRIGRYEEPCPQDRR